MINTRYLQRRAGLAALVLSIFLWSGCGDTFRPVVIPIPPTPPDPRNAHTVFAITNNGSFNPGSIMLMDVAGDTTAGVGNAGIGPSYAAVVPPGASHLVVTNEVDNSVTAVTTSGFTGGLTAPTTITLSPHFNPVAATSTENNIVYVASLGDAAQAVNPTVAAINLISNTVTDLIDLTAPSSATPNPIAEVAFPFSMIETPDSRKIYVASQGVAGTSPGSVTSINAVDKSSNPLITDPSINVPIAIVSRSDSARVYVLSQGNGDLATIDTSSDALVAPSTPVSVGAGADFMLYDSRLNRLYITNSAAGTLTILDATSDPPNVLATLSLPAGANASCAIGCASVAALPDGTRAYVTTLHQNGNNVAALVTGINTSTNSIVGSVSLPATPALANCTGTLTTPQSRYRISTVASADSSRIFVGNCDSGDVNVLRVSNNSLVSLPAPVSAANPSRATITAASQSGSQTIYNYTLTSGPALQVGMSMVVTGMASSASNDNGSFTISALGPGTFSVLNPSGVSATGQAGLGIATPLQNPVFLIAGP